MESFHLNGRTFRFGRTSKFRFRRSFVVQSIGTANGLVCENSRPLRITEIEKKKRSNQARKTHFAFDEEFQLFTSSRRFWSGAYRMLARAITYVFLFRLPGQCVELRYMWNLETTKC